MYFIGLDLGTSALKLLLMDEGGRILNIVTKEYPLEFPQPGWSQQSPDDWLRAVLSGVPELLQGLLVGAKFGSETMVEALRYSDNEQVRDIAAWLRDENL